MNDKYNDLIKSYESFMDMNQAPNSQLSSLDLSTINNNKIHYLCTKCFKFPYIKFYKDKRFIRINCSCIKNEKILIKDYMNKLSIENGYKSFFNTNNDKNIEKGIKCVEHKRKFRGFSKVYLKNYCLKCINESNNKKDIIRFDKIKIEDKKIDQFLKIINCKTERIKIISFEDSNIINRTKIII